MRRKCKDKAENDTILEHLKNNVSNLNFPTSKIIEQAKLWVDRYHPVNNGKSKEAENNRMATQFPKLLRSSQIKNCLQSNVMLAYQRPQTLGNFVTCYRKLLFGPHEGNDGGISGPCSKCALCGNHDAHNSMVQLMKYIRTPNGERRCTQKLNCKDYGIYAAHCKNYDNYYVGQTMTYFSQRWAKHRVL